MRPRDHRDNLAALRSGTTGLVALVTTQLKAHAPFTMLGTLTGVIIMVAFVAMHVPRTISVTLFWSMHPLHVLFSALVTTAMFTLHSRRSSVGHPCRRVRRFGGHRDPQRLSDSVRR